MLNFYSKYLTKKNAFIANAFSKNRFCNYPTIILFFLFIIGIIHSGNGATITSTTVGGAWSTAGSWVGGIVPATADSVIINGPIRVGASISRTGSVTIINGGNFSARTNGTSITIGSLYIFNGGTFSTSRNLTINGVSNISGSIIFTSAGKQYAFNGDIILNNGAVWNETASITPTITGSFTNNATSMTINSGSTYIFNKSFGGYFSGTKNISIPNLSISNNITYTNNATLTVSTSLSGKGGLTQSSTGLLNIGGTSGISTLTATATGNIVNYTGASQTLNATTYYNLTLSGTGIKTTTGVTVNGTLSMEGAATVSAALTYGSAATLQYKGASLQNTGAEFPATWSGSGGIKIENAIGVLLKAAKNIGANPFTIGSIIPNSVFNDGGFSLSASGIFNLNSGTYNDSAASFPAFTTCNIATGTTVKYSGAKTQTIKGIVYSNLTISGNGNNSKVADNNITVNGIINLAASNASSTQGCLSMSAYTLTMGLNATTTGIGDVSGIVTRYGTFVAATPYSFGNANTVINFSNTGTYPSSISMKITLGSTPSWKTGALLRQYEIIRTGGSTTSANIQFHYIDAEINSNTEPLLTVWQNLGTVTEIGRSSHDQTVNFVEISNVDITQFPTTFSAANLTLATTGKTFFTWNGSVSSDWTDIRNWAGNIVPVSTSNVYIPNPSTYTLTTPYYINAPTMPVSVDINTLNIEDYAVVNTSSGTQLTIEGGSTSGFSTFEGMGTFNAGNSTVIFKAADATYTGRTNFNNITISTGANLLMSSGSNMKIAGTITNNGTWSAGINEDTVEYNGSISQTIPNPNGLTPGYHSLILSGTGAKSFTSINVRGDFINNSTTTTLGSINFTGPSNMTQEIMGSTPTTFSNLTLNNSSFLSLNNDLSVSSSLTLTTGSLDIATYHLSISGSINSSSGTIDADSGTIILSGNSTQTISSFLNNTVNNLVINNSSGVSLGSNLTNSNSLTLTNGSLNLSSYNLNISGNISRTSGTINAGTGTVTMNGSLAQTIDGSIASSLYNLAINNFSGVTLSSNITVSNALTLNSGTLSIGSNNLTVSGSMSFTDGNIEGSLGTLTFNGSSSQTIPAEIFANNLLNNLTINNSAGVSLSGALSLTGSLTPTAGTLYTGGYLRLISTATSTARIANGNCSTCSYISGNIVVERYIPAVARRYRFLSSPMTSAALSDWQNEIFVTGPGTGTTIGTTNSNGFDATPSNSSSCFYYNENSSTWASPADISYSFEKGKGYRIFIRGDNSDIGELSGVTTTQNEVTLDLNGAVNQGNVLMPVTYTSTAPSFVGWCLLGNPYPSSFDWHAYYLTGNTGTSGTHYANIGASITIYNPTSGGYQSYNALTNSGTGQMNNNGIIPPGSAFWAQAISSNPSMTFTESFKVDVNAGIGLFKTNTNNFSVTLIKDSLNSDELVVNYISTASDEEDVYDMIKMNGGEVNISSLTPTGKQLTGNSKPFNGLSDTIPLFITLKTEGNYKLLFKNATDLVAGKSIELLDSVTGNRIDLTKNTAYIYTPNTSTETLSHITRFKLLIGCSSAITTGIFEALPVAKTAYKVYPTITHSTTNVYCNNEKSNTTIKITDVSGRIIFYSTTAIGMTTPKEIDFSGYTSGLYLMTITDLTSGISQTVKVIKE